MNNIQKQPTHESPSQHPSFQNADDDQPNDITEEARNYEDHEIVAENSKRKKRNRRWVSKSKYRRQKNKKLKESISMTYNFSSLSPAAKSLLNKGLKFCPTPKGINTTQLYADMFRMERKLAWKHFFRNNDFNSKQQETFPFPTKGQQTNLPKDDPSEIKEFAKSVESELLGTKCKDIHHNLSKEEREALDELLALQKAGSIAIQPADKGSGICILDRKDYEAEAYRQLKDTLEKDGEKSNYYKNVAEKNSERTV